MISSIIAAFLGVLVFAVGMFLGLAIGYEMGFNRGFYQNED
jgi:hypothetical protein